MSFRVISEIALCLCSNLTIIRHCEGTVTVNQDCSGVAVVTLPPNAPTSANPVHIDAFWVDNRESVFLIQTDTDTFIAGEATKLRHEH